MRLADPSSTKKLPPEEDSCLTCQQRRWQHACQWRTSHEADHVETETSPQPLRDGHEIHSLHQDSLAESNCMTLRPVLKAALPDSGYPVEQDQEPSQPELASNETYANSIVAKIRRGMTNILNQAKQQRNMTLKKGKKAKKLTGTLGLSCLDAVSYCSQWAVDPAQTMLSFLSPAYPSERQESAVLTELEEGFSQSYKTNRRKRQQTWWPSWYFAGCCSLILHLKGLRKLDRRATGIRVMHGIVNRLLATDGSRALVVICALSGDTFIT